MDHCCYLCLSLLCYARNIINLMLYSLQVSYHLVEKDWILGSLVLVFFLCFVTFPYGVTVQDGTWLYRFLIFAVLSTLFQMWFYVTSKIVSIAFAAIDVTFVCQDLTLQFICYYCVLTVSKLRYQYKNKQLCSKNSKTWARNQNTISTILGWCRPYTAQWWNYIFFWIAGS